MTPFWLGSVFSQYNRLGYAIQQHQADWGGSSAVGKDKESGALYLFRPYLFQY